MTPRILPLLLLEDDGGIAFAGVEDETTNLQSLHWTLPTNRLHWTLDRNRLHHTLPVNRLHFILPDN